MEKPDLRIISFKRKLTSQTFSFDVNDVLGNRERVFGDELQSV